MSSNSEKALHSIDRINAVGRFNYIVLTLEDIISPRRNTPVRFSKSAEIFLQRWGKFLNETDAEVLAQIQNPFAYLTSRYAGEDFHNKKIATTTLRNTLGFISSGVDISTYLQAAVMECDRDYETYVSLLDEIATAIEELSIEEFKSRTEGNKAESLVYWTSRSGYGERIANAVVQKFLQLDDETFLKLNFSTLYSGLSGLDMQNPKHRATHKNDLDHLSILLANKTIEILNLMSGEELFQKENFDVLRQVFSIPTHETMETWAFDETIGMNLINKLVDYVADLPKDQRQKLDPDNKKTFFLTKYSVDERLPRFVQDQKLVLLNGPAQTPENADRLAKQLLGDSTDLSKPLKCGTPELRLLIKFGHRDTARQILENYANRPASDFTFNCARFFEVIRNETATTIREEEELALLPHLVDQETQLVLEQKFIDAMLEQPSLCEYEFLDQVLRLAKDSRPQITDEVIIPRLFSEVFGEPISRDISRSL